MKQLLLAVACFVINTSSKKFIVSTDSINSDDDKLDIDMIMKNMEMEKSYENGQDYQDEYRLKSDKIGRESQRKKSECRGK